MAKTGKNEVVWGDGDYGASLKVAPSSAVNKNPQHPLFISNGCDAKPAKYYLSTRINYTFNRANQINKWIEQNDNQK
jgi:hypothetical protein